MLLLFYDSLGVRVALWKLFKIAHDSDCLPSHYHHRGQACPEANRDLVATVYLVSSADPMTQFQRETTILASGVQQPGEAAEKNTAKQTCVWLARKGNEAC